LIRRRYFIGGRYIDAILMGLDVDQGKSGAPRAP
jgi:hypothetical protein